MPGSRLPGGFANSVATDPGVCACLQHGTRPPRRVLGRGASVGDGPCHGRRGRRTLSSHLRSLVRRSSASGMDGGKGGRGGNAAGGTVGGACAGPGGAGETGRAGICGTPVRCSAGASGSSSSSASADATSGWGSGPLAQNALSKAGRVPAAQPLPGEGCGVRARAWSGARGGRWWCRRYPNGSPARAASPRAGARSIPPISGLSAVGWGRVCGAPRPEASPG